MRESAVRILDYDEDAGVVVVSFPFDQALNALLKSELPGMRWDRLGRRWTLPATYARRASQVLVAKGFKPTAAFKAVSGFDGQPPDELAGPGAGAAPAELPRGARTVGDLVADIQRALAASFPGPMWVVGTVLGLDKVAQRASRFYPFSLAEWDDAQGKPVCQLDAVMWPDVYQSVSRKFRGAGVEIRDTLPVLLKVSVRMWESAGKLQLYVEDADPSYTVGKVLENVDVLHERLIREGLADRNRTLPWPDMPLRIGVITAAKDAFADFRKILTLSGFPFEIRFVESRVQGPRTADSVVAALARLAREELDVIALIRGGGANADLSWFNDYAIGRAICLCPVPVIVGIGHDRDETLPDRLTRSRSTPTAVAEALAKQVQAAWSARASRAAWVLERVKARLSAAQAALRLHRARLARLPLQLASTQLPLREQRLRAAAARALERARHGLEIRSRDLSAKDPVRLLAMGYARLATREGRVVRRAADLAVGQEILLRMADGTASARIHDIEVRKTEETPA